MGRKLNLFLYTACFSLALTSKALRLWASAYFHGCLTRFYYICTERQDSLILYLEK